MKLQTLTVAADILDPGTTNRKSYFTAALGHDIRLEGAIVVVQRGDAQTITPLSNMVDSTPEAPRVKQK